MVCNIRWDPGLGGWACALVAILLCCFQCSYCELPDLSPKRASGQFSMLYNGARITHPDPLSTEVYKAPILCAWSCTRRGWCVLFDYSQRSGQCNLYSAMTLASMEPTHNGDFAVYQLLESFTGKLEMLAPNISGFPSLTNCTYQSHALAASECQRTDQHLCQLGELGFAYDAGYRSEMSTTRTWYVEPDRQAVLSSNGVVIMFEPLSTPAPGFCCPGLPSARYLLITNKTYALKDVEGQAIGCAASRRHPCTLRELKEVFVSGFRKPDRWMYYAEPNRDAKLFNNGCGNYVGAECFEDTVANTARPAILEEVCCYPDYD